MHRILPTSLHKKKGMACKRPVPASKESKVSKVSVVFMVSILFTLPYILIWKEGTTSDEKIDNLSPHSKSHNSLVGRSRAI